MTCHLSRGEIAALAGREKRHRLNPNGVRVERSLGDAAGLTGLGFHHVTLACGRESTELHRHHYEDECIYILSGRGEVRTEDGVFEVAAGDFVGHPAGGQAHVLRNVGDTPLTYLMVGQRLAHDVVDYPERGIRLYRNAGREPEYVDVAAIGTPPRDSEPRP